MSFEQSRPTLRLEREGAVARVLIDRGGKRNAMTQAMWRALPDLIDQATDDPRVRVLVLQSAVTGVFCAGADIAELAANAHDHAWLEGNQAAIGRAQHVLTRAAKPTIAMIDGDCIGGGCGLALACDFRVAAPIARFGVTPAKLGLVYPFHDTKLLADLVGPANAKRLLFTGALIDADEALRIGLVCAVAASPAALVEALLAASPASQGAGKAMVRKVLDGQVDEDDLTRATFATAFQGDDFRKGVAAFLARRPPSFD